MGPSDTKAASAEAVYDDIGAAYEAAFVGHGPQLASIEWLEQQVSSKKSAKCLDIGSGTGKPVCSSLAAAGHDVLGIDISQAMISAARERVPDAKFEKLSFKDFQAEPESFDAITVYFSLILGVTLDDIESTIKQIYSWLRPGGVFVFATVTVPEACENVQMKWMGKDVVVSCLETKMATNLVKQTGFEIVLAEASQFSPKGVEAGICKAEDIWEEDQLFVYAKKK